MSLSSFPAEGVEGESPNWLELPGDIITNILQRLDTIDIVTSASQVCPLWWNICKDPLMWRTIRITIDGCDLPYNLAKICHFAIERSCCQLEDIDIHRFGTDDLLNCIASKGSHLRRLRLVNCYRISDKGFMEAAKQFSRLEELDISYMVKLSKDSFEAIGQSCPLLKSLKYNLFCEEYYCDDQAFAIGKTMPKLHHLSIKRNMLTNDGLLAILDGCPLLKSLDLRFCFHLEFNDNLEKRCSEQINFLRLPYDEFDYFDYDDTYMDRFNYLKNSTSPSPEYVYYSTSEYDKDSSSENGSDSTSEYGYDYDSDDFY